ncbi:MAG: hypothetical protein KBC62_00305 [Candidatus Pacebacteria bacterium]|nr:hypothetical protein [Candidatus Paceibacterota bacterium]MBP9842426.1 hypothetical protein [Candidatus Paceibacterota bacterium]
MNPSHEYTELKEIILENQKLLAENNQLLKKMHRSTVRHFWLNIAWIVFLVVSPMFLLYKFILPMYSSIGASTTSVSGQLQDLNELRSFLQEQQ